MFNKKKKNEWLPLELKIIEPIWIAFQQTQLLYLFVEMQLILMLLFIFSFNVCLNAFLKLFLFIYLFILISSVILNWAVKTLFGVLQADCA